MNLGTRKARGKSVDASKFLPFYKDCIGKGLSKADTVALYNQTFGVDTSEASFTQKVQNLRDTLEKQYDAVYGKRFQSYKDAGQVENMEKLAAMIHDAVNDAIPPFSGERKNAAKNILKGLVKDFDLPGMDDLSEEI